LTQLDALLAARLRRIALMVLGVPSEVAPLAQRSQIGWLVVARVVVQVSHGQHDLSSTPSSLTLFDATKFALPIRLLSNLSAD